MKQKNPYGIKIVRCGLKGCWAAYDGRRSVGIAVPHMIPLGIEINKRWHLYVATKGRTPFEAHERFRKLIAAQITTQDG